MRWQLERAKTRTPAERFELMLQFMAVAEKLRRALKGK